MRHQRFPYQLSIRRSPLGDVRRTIVAIAVLVIVVSGAMLAAVLPAVAQSRPVVYDEYDVTLVVNENGIVDITERQVVDFRGGPFRRAFATIPLDRIDDLGNIRVSEQRGAQTVAYDQVDWRDWSEDDPETFAIRVTATDVQIDWAFPPTRGETRTFILEYSVAGVIRQYLENDPPNQQLWWTAIAPDVPDVAPIEDASATIVLPQAIELEDARVDQYESDSDIPADPGASLDPAEFTENGQTWTFNASNLDSSGEGLVVRLQFPPLVDAAVPSWQVADDDRRREDAVRADEAATLNLLFLFAGIGVIVVGGAGTLGLWYVRGRDPHIGLIADIVPEPPDDLPPGVAGALIDEQVHTRDVLATLVDLGERGIINMTESPGQIVIPGMPAFGHDFTITLEKDDPGVAPFERDFLRALFGDDLSKGRAVKLGDVKRQFDAAIPELTADLYQELVDYKYFDRSPEATRRIWKRASDIMIWGTVIGGVVFIVAFQQRAALAWVPLVATGILAFVFRRLSHAMPRKTMAGAEAAAKWRAFKRYLESIETYERLEVEDAKIVFDRFLPYAVAFGIERQFVGKFQMAGLRLPQMFGELSTATGQFGGPGHGGQMFDPDRGYGRQTHRRGPYVGGPFIGTGTFGGQPNQQGGGGGGNGPDVNMPDLNDASRGAFGGLGSGSEGLFDMLNSAARVFGGMSGGGGWGGGGGFGGGGGGGGSSGGGSRGFG